MYAVNPATGLVEATRTYTAEEFEDQSFSASACHWLKAEWQRFLGRAWKPSKLRRPASEWVST